MKIIHFDGVYPGPEDDWVYNVTSEEYFESDCYDETAGQQIDRNTYFWTTREPPPLRIKEPSEFLKLYEGAQRCIHAYLERHYFPPVDLFGRPLWGPTEKQYEEVMLSYSEDRTLTFHSPFNDPSITSLDLIESLQREIVQPNPLWRIRFLEDLLIYPDAVRASTLPASLGQRQTIERWLPRHLEYEKEGIREESKQFLFIKERLRSHFEPNNPATMAILGVFDDFPRELDFCGAWVLHPRNSFLSDPANGYRAGSYPVSMHGEIGPSQWLEERATPYQLTWFGIPRDQPIEIQVRLTREGLREESTLEYPLDDITSQAELEAWCWERGIVD